MKQKKPILKNRYKLNCFNNKAVLGYTFSIYIHGKNKKQTEEELSEAKNAVKKMGNKKNKIWSILFLLLNVAVIAFIIWNYSKDGGLIGIGDLFSTKINYTYFVLAIFALILLNIIETLKISNLLKKSTKRKRLRVSYKTMALGRYYDCVTPLSLGGEPYQIYYLHSRGVSGDLSASIPFTKQIFWQISYTMIALGLFIYNVVTGLIVQPIVLIMSWVGLALTLGAILVVFFFSISKKIAPRVAIWVLKLLNKMHIIKDYKLAFRKVLRFVKNYQRSLKYFTTNIGTLLMQFFLAIVGIICNALIVHFVYLSFNAGAPLTFLETFTMTMICELATSFIPIPGGTVAAEFTFDAIFRTWFTPNVFGWALLIWRFLTYYFYIFQGFFILIYDYAYGNKKNRIFRHQEKLERERLEQEKLLTEQSILIPSKNAQLKEERDEYDKDEQEIEEMLIRDEQKVKERIETKDKIAIKKAKTKNKKK